MRGTRAKALRRLARSVTIGMPERTLVAIPQTQRTTEIAIPVKVKKLGTVLGGQYLVKFLDKKGEVKFKTSPKFIEIIHLHEAKVTRTTFTVQNDIRSCRGRYLRLKKGGNQ